MNILRITYLLICFALFAGPAHGQVDTAATDSIRIDRSPKSSDTDSLSADSTEAMFKIVPWQYRSSLNSRTVATDSTLRWQLWPDWTYKMNREPGAITYRMGSIIRNNAFLRDAHEPRYQRLLWEDMTINDPVSGSLNWSFIPHHKISSFHAEDEGTYHDSHYYLKQYYLTKPLSYLNYTESKYDYRSLEFMVSRNFTRKVNVEMSYWDRRGGGEYSNSGVNGRQIFARVFYQPDRKQSLKLHFLNNNYDIGQSFGYVIPDLQNFAFDRFQTQARQPRARSQIASTNIALNYYRRGEDTTRTQDHFHAGIFFNNRQRGLSYTADTTFYQVQSVGTNARRWFDWNTLSLEGGVGYEFFFNKDQLQSNIESSGWGLLEAEGEANFHPLSFLNFRANAEVRHRSDNYTSHRYRLGMTLGWEDYITLKLNATQGTSIPTPQQLYWNSFEYQGNGNLENEQISEAGAELSSNLFSTLKLGVKAQAKIIDNAIMVGQDSTFANMPAYSSLSLSPYIDYESSLIEFSASATYHTFDDRFTDGNDPLFLSERPRLWLKGSAYLKGYLFDRATYVKGGLAGMFSPYRYRAGHYNPVLDFWQPLSNDQLLPYFTRLDAEVSARVRTILILLRWENILDDVNQLGYFETAGYPMTGRRFLFGVRVLFRN